jgi:hypothetical protein
LVAVLGPSDREYITQSNLFVKKWRGKMDNNKKLFEGLLKADGIDPSNITESERMVFREMLDQQLKTKKSKLVRQPDIWRIIMKSKITKLAAAAVIIIAVLIGINQFGGSNAAWAQIVQTIERSYNQYHDQLQLTMDQKDLNKASENANALSEFWQGIHILAQAKLNPTVPLNSEDSLNIIKLTFEKTVFDDIDKNVFQNYANEFLNWFNQIQDENWIHESIHISKQMEEYAEEIRDAGRHSELGWPYAEHCLAGFFAYSNSFEQLPWDYPGQYMTPDKLLAAVERDLQTARQEITALKIRGADRFAKRSLQQAQRNAQSLSNLISPQNADVFRLSRKLNQKIDESLDLISYLTIASGDIIIRNKIDFTDAVKTILTKEFADKNSFSEYFIDRIDQALELSDQLIQKLECSQ